MAPPTNAHESLPTAAADGVSISRYIRAPVATLSFWAAIAMPILYLPLLLNGIESLTGLGLFLGLLGLHLLTLLGGRNYRSQPE